MDATVYITIGDRRRDRLVLLERAARAATGLQSMGVARGSVVALLLRNDFAFLEASSAAGQLGAYVTPINWHCAPGEVRYLLEDAGAEVLIAHADLLRSASEVLPAGLKVLAVPTPEFIADAYGASPMVDTAGWHAHASWDEWLMQFEPRTEPPLPAPGAMMYTSGTTGRPKGVQRRPPSPDEAAGMMDMLTQLTGLGEHLTRPQDVIALIPTPLYHATPNAWMTAALALGTHLIVEPRFDAERLLQRIEQYRVTHLLLVPTMFVRLLQLPEAVRGRYDLSSLRFVMHGGAPCPAHVKRRMIDWLGPVLFEHYGGTEVGAVSLCDTAEWLAHPGTVGRALPHVELAVYDAEGRKLGPGEPGEIHCRNRRFPDFTYRGDDAKRAGAEKAGLISLGDIGYLDGDGFLHLCGRATEMIISGGANIYPAEIEAELLKMPGVEDCAVFGIPDEEYGELVCAAILAGPGSGVRASAVQQFLRARLAGYKIPKQIEIAATLPREDSGKVFKHRLRERLIKGD